MPANHKVSVGWQIVFTFITGLNFWAFYRIRKLRKYVLCVMVPELAITIAFFAFLSTISADDTFFGSTNIRPGLAAPGDPQSEFDKEFLVLTNAYFATVILGLGLQGFAIYLVVIWSREHNRTFDASPSQEHTSLW